MSYEIQSMLLRVLQENTYTPIGSDKERVADVRIVTATNENLQLAIKEGRFREDLYHRLCEFEIRQPSLAECPEDIIPLAEFFRERHSKGFGWDIITILPVTHPRHYNHTSSHIRKGNCRIMVFSPVQPFRNIRFAITNKSCSVKITYEILGRTASEITAGIYIDNQCPFLMFRITVYR